MARITRPLAFTLAVVNVAATFEIDCKYLSRGVGRIPTDPQSGLTYTTQETLSLLFGNLTTSLRFYLHAREGYLKLYLKPPSIEALGWPVSQV